MENSIIFGALAAIFVVLLSYVYKTYLGRAKVQVDDNGSRNNDNENRKPVKKEVTKTKKKVTDQRWSSRSKQQQFAHPWHLTTFKGHTGTVLDLDFSTNGKYLATCSDEDPGSEDRSTTGSSSEQSSTQGSETPPPRGKGLSRRQKKNRRIADASAKSELTKKKSRRRGSAPKATDGTTSRMRLLSTGHNLSHAEFYDFLRHHVLTDEQLFDRGFATYDGTAVAIFKSTLNFRRPFVRYPDSDQSNNSNDGSENEPTGSDEEAELDSRSPEHSCCRCYAPFKIVGLKIVSRRPCVYHWGRLVSIENKHQQHYYLKRYSCCKRPANFPGCTTGTSHVWTGLDDGLTMDLPNFVTTRRQHSFQRTGNAYALDCEMCFTYAGMEVCKVAVVDMRGVVVYNQLVKPRTPVLDYNTRFSGVTEDDVVERGLHFDRVKAELLSFIDHNTILIGHSLHTDLRCLEIVHELVVDTSVVFAHPRGEPYTYSLKDLCLDKLHIVIQSSDNGHDPCEDALCCMKLMLLKCRQFKNVLSLTRF